ncbi:MAG: UDP-N-acetylmuramoyl-tripeptide--D-alanyl-D-alanine ligase [Deltaproteobacteria bacterium]|nr:MAG: UDP-N-acetylmuramoyl-tripeptide--D-alanyl-D-alanine ligase [Deltaproteobacteria bacterium]
MSSEDYKFSVKTILEATGGVLAQGDPQASFAGVSTDSRSIRSGELFFALKGEKFDGSQFIAEAAKKGGTGGVVEKEIPGILAETIPVIKVRDTLQALGDLASFWRERHPIPLVAITGSNGKTTTKEMLAGILGESYKVLKNPGNFNNLIGLPLSLLKLNSQDQVAVLEMGMNRKGEIRRLTQIAKPDLAILTNISPVHLEGLKSLKGIMEAKGELLDVMEAQGRLILNADDPRVVELSERFRGAKTSFGITSLAHWVATDISTRGDGGVSFRLNGPIGKTSISLSIMGRHQVYNALAASAAASHLAVGLKEIKRGLGAFQPPPMRMELIILGQGIKIINDVYNANPKSVESALSTLEEVTEGRKIAVLGDMWELGAYAPQAHTEAGRLVKEKGVALLFLLGEFSRYVAQGATDAGMNPKAIFIGKDHQGLSHQLARSLKKGDCVLIKGSRIMKMEKVIEDLRNQL